MTTRTVAAVLVAAGRGERAGQSREGPKQYRSIGGRPVLWHTLKAFMSSRVVDRIAVVIHPDDRERFDKATDGLDGAVEVVLGGPTRQASVRQALLAFRAAPPDIVLIHDAVRPFVEASLIATVVHSVEANAGALPAIPVSDTLKRVSDSGHVMETVARKGLFAAQTPQGFPYRLVAEAHEAAAAQHLRQFTDDASLVEWIGGKVAIVPGSPDNVKLTVARDIVLADRKLRGLRGVIDVRTGNGYDVHQLVDGEHVTLCGVRIPHDRALSGHSDADVGLHALTDALLATCGAGDIGDHFPPSDPQWRGVASRRFVEHAVHIVASRGGRIANADITLICEAPKIAPHREAMRLEIAAMTGLAVERVSVKATTNESIGFVGRREGIAAIATASVSFEPGEPAA